MGLGLERFAVISSSTRVPSVPTPGLQPPDDTVEHLVGCELERGRCLAAADLHVRQRRGDSADAADAIQGPAYRQARHPEDGSPGVVGSNIQPPMAQRFNKWLPASRSRTDPSVAVRMDAQERARGLVGEIVAHDVDAVL